MWLKFKTMHDNKMLLYSNTISYLQFRIVLLQNFIINKV